ncbi:MAG: translation initiation factor IF-3 [Candidatus Aquicultorales bacterium]
MATDVRVNDRIRAAQVRLIAENGDQLGIKSTQEAMKIASDAGLDLVEVAPQADPPVARIMDYGKYKYEQTIKAKKARKRSASSNLKEMKLRPKIETHDFETKKKHIVRFLEGGSKVKVTIMFRGREMAHTEIGRRLLDRMAGDLADMAKVESPPKQDGRNMIMVLTPVPRLRESKEETGVVEQASAE